MDVQLSPPQHVRATVFRVLVLLSAGVLLLPLLSPPAHAQEDDGDVTPARVTGLNRFDTAARIAALTFDEAEVAIVVTGADYPDALAGSFAAGRLQAPILLVEQDAVPTPTRDTLEDLGVQTVVLLGGTVVISQEVEESLESEGYTVDRIAGEDRYETAAQIALAYGQDTGGRLDGDRPAILASGEDFPDALSAGPVAARAGLPLLLTPSDRTLPVVDDALEQLGIQRIIVIGGASAVSSAVVEAYQAEGYAVERWAGVTRDATATVVADNAISRLDGFSERLVLLARGDDYPDALAASIHGALLGAPILLTADPDRLGDATDGWLADRCPDVNAVRALGGTAAVSADTLDAAVDAADRCTRTGGDLQEVARYTTPLIGKPNRTHNLHLAADYIDGDVIAAGTSYSLNQGIGRRTRARGFREVENGCIDSQGNSFDCVGGGVSQMGTTFMNAAWFTGVDIPEWRQHTLYFSRYPMCHEATLSWGSLDVVVRNNSPYDILIDAFYDDAGEFIGVRFLSQEWAEVESWTTPADPPPVGSGPFDTSCGRTITYPDGSQDSESFSWRYDDRAS